MKRLGVNIDHIATLRQVRLERYPNIIDAAEVCRKRKVAQITVHLREDRRHIQDQDVVDLMEWGKLPVNLEICTSDEMVEIALKHKPAMVTLVPEKRKELTTEGGLNLLSYPRRKEVKRQAERLSKKGIKVSLFLDPDMKLVQATKKIKSVDAIEFHTGAYCHLLEEVYQTCGSYRVHKGMPRYDEVQEQLLRLKTAAHLAAATGIKAYAGHGLHTKNLKEIRKIDVLEEYNIGHAIVARAVLVGLDQAIQEIQEALE